MSDFWYEMLKSTSSALIWAFLGWLFLALRNWKLEFQLKKSFGNHGLTYGIEGMGIVLSNPTSYEITVREVSARTAETTLILNHMGPKEDESARKHVTLPPWSDSKWIVPRGFYKFQKSDFTSVTVEFLYPSLFGSLRRLTVSGNEDLIDGFNKIRKQDEVEAPRLEAIQKSFDTRRP